MSDWQDQEADVNDAPRRPVDGEDECLADGSPWCCERQAGHAGNHMAWSDYENRVLYERGEWS